jgi:hypothetical protein
LSFFSKKKTKEKALKVGFPNFAARWFSGHIPGG